MEVRSSSINHVFISPMTSVLIREEKSQRHRGEGHEKVEAAPSQPIPEAPRHCRGKEGSSPRVFRGNMVLLIP